MKNLYIIIALLLIATSILTACSNEEDVTPSTEPTTTSPSSTEPTTTPTEQQPKYGGTLKILDAMPMTPPFGFPPDPMGMGAHRNPFTEALIWGDSENNYEPVLATDWELASDLKSITFTIRDGVKFHDGTDFNAEAAKWNLDQYIALRGDSFPLTSVDIVDQNAIRVNLREFKNIIYYNISTYMMVSPTTYEEKGVEWMADHIVGTGPFVQDSYTPQVSITGTKFDDYWADGKPYLDAVEIWFVPDPLTRSAAFLAGEADAIGGDLTQIEYDIVQQGYPVQWAYSGTNFLYGDAANEDSPFYKLEVRQAVDYAIDRDAIVDARGFGFWAATYHISRPGASYEMPELNTIRSYDPEKAKQLLAEAGYPDGFSTTLYVNQANIEQEAATAVQSYLAAVGIDAEMKMVDFASYLTLERGGFHNGLAMTANPLSSNVNYLFNWQFVQSSLEKASIAKPDELEQLMQESIRANPYSDEKAQAVIKYIFDYALQNQLWVRPRGIVLQPYVRDTGHYTGKDWPDWKPADAWLDK